MTSGFWILYFWDSQTIHLWLESPIPMVNPNSNGMLNLGVRGVILSSWTRDKSCIEYSQERINDMIRSSRRWPNGISSVARGTNPKALMPEI